MRAHRESAQRIAEFGPQPERRLVEGQLAGGDLREVEQIVDDAQEILCLSVRRDAGVRDP
jgi:hypothetical protein